MDVRRSGLIREVGVYVLVYLYDDRWWTSKYLPGASCSNSYVNMAVWYAWVWCRSATAATVQRILRGLSNEQFKSFGRLKLSKINLQKGSWISIVSPLFLCTPAELPGSCRVRRCLPRARVFLARNLPRGNGICKKMQNLTRCTQQDRRQFLHTHLCLAAVLAHKLVHTYSECMYFRDMQPQSSLFRAEIDAFLSLQLTDGETRHTSYSDPPLAATL